MTAISAGRKHNCAVVNGAAMCWGSNRNSELGNTDLTESSVPVVVNGLESGVSAISASYEYTCAVVEGRAKCWGLNLYGQLGVPKAVEKETADPIDVEGLSKGATVVSADDRYACTVVKGGVHCWGITDFSTQVPDDTVVSTVPISVKLE